MHEAGHLTALGWTTFALYSAAALLSFRAAIISNRGRRSTIIGERFSETVRIWSGLGVMLAALGLNKVMDLQTLLNQLGRDLAGEEIIYAHRAALRVLFFLGFIAVVIAVLAVVALRFSAAVGRFARRQPLAAGGCVLIGIYILLRAAAIEHVDQMLGFELERIPFLWLLEAGGLLLVIIQSLHHPGPNR